ncbi:MAG: glycosyl hydrolase, partial [Planctomycetota bacterium]|nr:glycosyl hydrolase [Planctomycetota bacterium]
MQRIHIASLVFISALLTDLAGQGQPPMPTELFQTLEWRSIGPFRGGRSAACTGVRGDRDTYYFGGCGGGVWKTTDAGRTWKNVSDEFFGGSIGAVAVAESDPNVVYAGGGEVTVRGNVASGSGMWRSTDAGKTWKAVGLKDSRHIPRIRVHPDNPDLVYAAVLGHISGPNEQRGVYRSKDGGDTWQKVLYANAHAGACDLVMDPANPRILYASTWRIIRTPHSLESGGEGSDLWKSTDSGDTWQKITGNKGLPEGTTGIIGIAVSPVDHERVWAIIENDKGGVFRSEDGGDTWAKINSERKLRQRAWYYSRIYADTQDVDVCYVVNVGFHRSKDGGKTFTSIRVPHGDNHDMWIDPDDSRRMIESNDGGANVSFNAGASWSAQDNQPTAQFYRVITDNHFPYRIYGAQQDNSTVRIASRSSSRRGIGERDWEPTAGGESGHIAPDPRNPDIVYGGSYGGYLSRRNHRTGENRNVNVWPDNPLGWGGESLKHRFQWNFPIFFSPHDPEVLYSASQFLCRSTDEGQSWQVVSPDLTTNDKSRQRPSGGPITKDNTGVEIYCTIFAAAESPLERGLLWCGSDDGLLHVSRDNGGSWKNVTPKDLPEWTQINSIEIHPTHKGGLYLAGTRYKLDDMKPYLYRTLDYGKSWTKITRGIDPWHFTRVIRADPKRQGLLYAGTEWGVYVSFDDGARWQPMQLNLPIVSITDLAIKEEAGGGSDLIAATQGRSFWILDNLDHIRQLSAGLAQKDLHLFTPEPSFRMAGGGGGRGTGKNPAAGVEFRFQVSQAMLDTKSEIALEIREDNGSLIHRYSTKSEKKDKKLTVTKGINRFEWDRRYEGALQVPGMILWAANLSGPSSVPGKYRAVLVNGDNKLEASFSIRKDPRTEASLEDIQVQFNFLSAVRDKLTETHEGIVRIRDIRSQVEGTLKKVDKATETKELLTLGKDLQGQVTEIEEALYQTKSKSRQDPLNFPIKLNNKLGVVSGAVARGDYRPTDQAAAVAAELTKSIDKQLHRLRDL